MACMNPCTTWVFLTHTREMAGGGRRHWGSWRGGSGGPVAMREETERAVRKRVRVLGLGY